MKIRDEIGSYLVDQGCLNMGVEIGVYRGEFAEKILRSWPGKLYLVDTWRQMSDYLDSWNVSDECAEQNLNEALRRMRPFRDRASIVRMESGEAVALFPDSYFDFVYIDANHSYSAVLRDMSLWYPKLRRGGVFSGHDYFDALADESLEPDMLTSNMDLPDQLLTSYGVKSAVKCFAELHQCKYKVTQEILPSWYFSKP